MELCLQQVKKINQLPGLDGIYKAITYAGRICYASNKNGEELEFVKQCVKLGHHRPLEFGTVYLYIDYNTSKEIYHKLYDRYKFNHYSRIELDNNSSLYITTNYRVLVENEWTDDLTYLVDCTKYHIPRYTFHWTIARGIADEFRTHVSLSSLMQSTRYCDYSKDKFSSQLTFVKPIWMSQDPINNTKDAKENFFISQLRTVEHTYLSLKKLGASAEEARDILPLCIKTEFVQCGFPNDWENFFNQRVIGTTGKPHPDAKYIAEKALNLLKNENNSNK